MYERFTDHARNVLKAASDEAERLQHDQLAAEHLLLGLLQERDGAAAKILNNLGADARKLRLEIGALVQAGVEMPEKSTDDETPGAANVIESAIEEALDINHKYVGTEHLLLGLLHARNSGAAKVLENAGLTAATVRQEIRKLIGEGFES
jgi:ATP-dependent Clp protease ATP-binding subunit ClpC